MNPGRPDDERLVVPRYLSIVEVDGDVLAGAMPPRAVRIEDAPPYLPELLSSLSAPCSRAEAQQTLARLAPALSEREIASVLEELVDAGVLATGDIDAEDRYARHALYFDLLGADPVEAQRRLSDATVGLVGCGGIGTHLATTLVAAGVGTLVLSDGDDVELSNLTRQTLFDEGSVGHAKVHEAVERLRRLSSTTVLRPVRSRFYGPELLDEHFSDCDVVVLSADTPADVHRWVNEAALRHGFAYSNAGYIEAFGVVGPMVRPRRSACYACIQATADLQDRDGNAPANLNRRHQAPSYGPLNAQVAAIQANEVIRELVGLPVQTVGQRLLVDSCTYAVHREDYERDPACGACGGETGDRAVASAVTLAQAYEREREHASQNALVLDELVRDLVPGAPGRRVLDVGCGSGHEVVRLAAAGSEVVGIDTDAEMLEVAARRVRDAGVAASVELGEDPPGEIEGPFDHVLCLNVLDYLEDPEPMIAELRRLVADDGQVIVAIPHPVKDRGGWRKERIGERWHYPEFVLDGYFEEGAVRKQQESAAGDALVTSTYFHRTTATWVQLLLAAGFVVRGLYEPAADPARADALPVLYEKSSRVPYFLVLRLTP